MFVFCTSYGRNRLGGQHTKQKKSHSISYYFFLVDPRGHSHIVLKCQVLQAGGTWNYKAYTRNIRCCYKKTVSRRQYSLKWGYWKFAIVKVCRSQEKIREALVQEFKEQQLMVFLPSYPSTLCAFLQERLPIQPRCTPEAWETCQLALINIYVDAYIMH